MYSKYCISYSYELLANSAEHSVCSTQLHKVGTNFAFNGVQVQTGQALCVCAETTLSPENVLRSLMLLLAFCSFCYQAGWVSKPCFKAWTGAGGSFPSREAPGVKAWSESLKCRRDAQQGGARSVETQETWGPSSSTRVSGSAPEGKDWGEELKSSEALAQAWPPGQLSVSSLGLLPSAIPSLWLCPVFTLPWY